MDAINSNYGASQTAQLVQQNAQQAAAQTQQAAQVQQQAHGGEEQGEHVAEATETREGNLGQNINTFA